jgi:hypothetical protein
MREGMGRLGRIRPNDLVAGMPTGLGEKEKEKPIGAGLHRANGSI